MKAAFEAEADRDLDRFFDRWIYGSALPRVKFSYTTEAGAVTVRFEQIGEIFDVPDHRHARSTPTRRPDVVVPLTEQVDDAAHSDRPARSATSKPTAMTPPRSSS